jgi:hypothetical protein
MTVCGLWLARRRLVAGLVGPHGRAQRCIRTALTDDARFGLLEYLAHVECEIVATDALARTELLPAQAVRRGISVWLAEDQLVAGLLGVAAVCDPARAAALLARMRLVPAWRAQLRRLLPANPARQLPLL